MSGEADIIARTERYSARNYNPLPVVIERGKGVGVIAVGGRWVVCMALVGGVFRVACIVSVGGERVGYKAHLGVARLE